MKDVLDFLRFSGRWLLLWIIPSIYTVGVTQTPENTESVVKILFFLVFSLPWSILLWWHVRRCIKEGIL